MNPEITGHQNHTVIQDGIAFILVDVAGKDGVQVFDPTTFGLKPAPICEQCQSGYYCTFAVDSSALYLTKLNILAADSDCPAIEGNEPALCNVDYTMEYRNLRVALQFSGTVRIGRGKITNVFNQRDQLGSPVIRELWDLEFENGRLIQTTDQMPLLRRQLKVQRQIIEFAADQSFDATRSKALFAHCRYHDPSAAVEHPWDSQEQSLVGVFKSIGRKISGTTIDKYQRYLSWSSVPLITALQPDAALQTLEYFRSIKGTPLWFVWAYNDSGLSCQLTFNYLRSLTVPAHIVSFLKRLVTFEVTEKMVILEFLESIRLTIAGDYWEERVLPGHLYTNANIPVDVTAAVRNRLASVTQENWG